MLNICVDMKTLCFGKVESERGIGMNGGYQDKDVKVINNLDHSSLYPSMNHKIDLLDPDEERKELREAIRSMLEEEDV